MFSFSACCFFLEKRLLDLASSLVRLVTQVRGGRAGALEEASEERLEQRAEDDLGAAANEVSMNRRKQWWVVFGAYAV